MSYENGPFNGHAVQGVRWHGDVRHLAVDGTEVMTTLCWIAELWYTNTGLVLLCTDSRRSPNGVLVLPTVMARLTIEDHGLCCS